jgi:transcriptional regulator with XRE-family HTH domain
VKKVVGNRIRKIREGKEITIKYMAGELEMTASAYYKIERGEINIGVSRLESIAKILKVSVVDFFQDKKEPSFAEDPLKNYGFATKADIEQLTQMMKQLKTEFENLKNKMGRSTKPASKKRK